MTLMTFLVSSPCNLQILRALHPLTTASFLQYIFPKSFKNIASAVTSTSLSSFIYRISCCISLYSVLYLVYRRNGYIFHSFPLLSVLLIPPHFIQGTFISYSKFTSKNVLIILTNTFINYLFPSSILTKFSFPVCLPVPD